MKQLSNQYLTMSIVIICIVTTGYAQGGDCRGCCTGKGGVVCADGKTVCKDQTSLSEKCRMKCDKCADSGKSRKIRSRKADSRINPGMSESGNISKVRQSKPVTVSAQVFFSPQGGVQDAIVAELDKARSEILVQAYSFTNAGIAKGLLNAKKRGVKITVVLDRSNKSDKYSSAKFMVNQQIPTFIDGAHKIAHNKVIVLDRETVITGSYNFSKAAEESNAENMIILRSADLAKYYIENFELHKNHSEAYGSSQ